MPLKAKGSMVWDRSTPCASCPYRRDAPRGLWSAVEFTNLMAQDSDPIFGSVFGCHEYNKRLPEEHRPCGGWLLDQKQRGAPSIRLRMTLSTNEQAAECFNKADAGGLELFSSIGEMVQANMKEMHRGPVKPKEYEIYRHAGQSGMYQEPTGLVIPAMTKKEAIAVARVKLGRGTYEAKESTPEQRVEQAKRGVESKRKLGMR